MPKASLNLVLPVPGHSNGDQTLPSTKTSKNLSNIKEVIGQSLKKSVQSPVKKKSVTK